MSDLTDLKFFIGSLIRPLIKEAVAEALESSQLTRPTSAPTDEVLSYEQAAALLNLTEQTLYGKVSRREIPFSKVGNRTYFSRLELIDWLKSHRTATVAEQVQQYDQSRSTRRNRATSKPGKAA